MCAYFVINIYLGSILGPVFCIEDAESQLKLVENPNEWIIVKEIKND